MILDQVCRTKPRVLIFSSMLKNKVWVISRLKFLTARGSEALLKPNMANMRAHIKLVDKMLPKDARC